MKKLILLFITALLLSFSSVHAEDIRIQIVGGGYPGLTYDAATGALSYDGAILSDNTAEYDTIEIPAGDFVSTATNGATFSTYEYATNDINEDYYAFDGTTEEYIEYSRVMPEDWDRSTVKVKFYWSSATSSTTNDTVEWEILGGALSDSDAIDAALGTPQVITDTLLADNGADLQITSATPALTIGGTPALGDLIHLKVSRNVGGTDDMTEDAWLYKVIIQYKKDNTIAAW